MSRARSSSKNNSTANLGFEAKLWLAADKLRSNMDAAKYKHVGENDQDKPAQGKQPKQINATTRRLAAMNLALRGIEGDFGPEQAETFRRDLHPDLRAD